MKYASFLALILILSTLQFGNSTKADDGKKPKSILDFTMGDIDGKLTPISSFKGKVILIVNVASRCGNTPQYKDLEALYQKYRQRGFTILAFPANNFGGQEPGADSEIKAFCQSTYHVSFPLFSKISVQGEDQHSFYRFLTSASTNPHFAGNIFWNFQKHLVDRNGSIIGKFSPGTEPLSNEIVFAIESALK
jgi:glutathione peroxidase